MTEKEINADPITGEKGSHPVGTGAGALGGVVAGAGLGGMIGGPLGALAGAAIGGIAGGMTGKELAETVYPTIGGDNEEHLVGEGVGATTGVLVGGAIGTLGGPIGTVAGAAIGAGLGGLAGEKIDEAVNPTPDEKLNRELDKVSANAYVPTPLSEVQDPTETITHEPTKEAINRVNHIEEEPSAQESLFKKGDDI